jgi:hypothetical protein
MLVIHSKNFILTIRINAKLYNKLDISVGETKKHVPFVLLLKTADALYFLSFGWQISL